ncbi:hypothetical protein GW17_00029814 [Ensete ventricosum]|nr:hypothetical protein GW17_00029814 [Ensete ventricosum]
MATVAATKAVYIRHRGRRKLQMCLSMVEEVVILPLGARSSRLRDRKKEEREILVKKAFLDDMMNESNLLFVLLAKATISSAVLWEPEMLPATCLGTQVEQSSSLSSEAHGLTSGDLHGIKKECQSLGKDSLDYEADACCTHDANETTADLSSRSSHCALFSEANENACNNTEGIVDDEIDLPFGLDVDSGSLACVAYYLKIKALAISIAEEINIQFNCEDVPLVNASSSDLDLINVSIDDEGHEEDGNDWTSKLGLNLRYCAKLKKQSPSNQEHLTLSLGGIFSGPSPTAVSNLKWLSRKSRTPHKVVGVIQSKSQFDINNEKCVLIDGKTNSITDSAKVTKVYRSLEPHHIGTMHHSLLIKGMLKESGSGNTIVKVDDRDDERRKCGSANKIISKMKDDTGDNLHTIPVLIAEYPQMHQVSWVTLRVTSYSEAVPPVKLPASDESDVGYYEQLEIHSDGLSCKEAVCEPVKSAGKQPFVDPELTQGFEEAYRSHDKFCSSDKSEILADRLTLESGTSEAQQVSAVDTANLGDEFNGNREAACGTGRRPLHYSSENLEDSCRTLLSDSQFLCLSESLINSEIQLNNLSVQEPLGDDMVANRANSNSMPDISINDGSKMLQEILVRTEHIADGANIIKSENYFAVNNLVVNNSEMLQKAHCADEMEAFVKTDGRTAFDHSVKLAEIFAISMAEGSVMQEVHSMELCGSADSSSLLNGVQPNYHNPSRVDLIQYVRRRNKRKRQQEQSTGCQDSLVCFVRSPCEGLRPRTLLKTDVKVDIFTLEKSSAIKERRKAGNSIVQREDKRKAFKCDIEGCFMSFQTRGELSLHKRDRCTIEGCGKRFSCHKYAVRHQCVHNDDRPLRCPWKGCNMTFKWAWARTEHVRVHTGERPYKCKFSGCGQTFRFVSDFSRHRRKTGHYATPSAG